MRELDQQQQPLLTPCHYPGEAAIALQGRFHEVKPQEVITCIFTPQEVITCTFILPTEPLLMMRCLSLISELSEVDLPDEEIFAYWHSINC